jgi:putative membrane protein
MSKKEKVPEKPAKEQEIKERLLILSVDRDNDVGEKTGIKGPVIGRAKVVKTATDLSIKDPEESDANALFGAVKMFDELKDKYECEVAAIMGHRSRGIESDREVTRQLDRVLQNVPCDFVVLVTDGKDDEYVTPIIQSKVPILSVKRIVVHQAEELESGYYKIKDFLKETLENSKVARLVFGLPAIALLLYAVFDMAGWRFILGFLGAYLFIKGFRLEDYVLAVFEELKNSFTKRRFAFFVYIVSFAITALAIYRGYNVVLDVMNTGLFEMVASFFTASVYFFWIAGMIAWLGNNMSLRIRSANRIASVPLFGLATSIIIYNVSDIILNPGLPIFSFLVSLSLGFVVAFIALLLETSSKD